MTTATEPPQDGRPPRPTRRSAALPRSGERVLPWLGAAVVMACCTLALAVLEVHLAMLEWAGLLIALGATVAAAGLVAARSRREDEAADRDERARPAQEQLLDMVDDDPAGSAGPGYVQGMERWASALLELVDHARDETPDAELRAQLTGMADDTRALRDLLRASDAHDLSLNEAAMLHSVCSLWETDQDRVEALAGDVDPAWHRRWRARAVVARRLRHGQRSAGQLVLPYRS